MLKKNTCVRELALSTPRHSITGCYAIYDNPIEEDRGMMPQFFPQFLLDIWQGETFRSIPDINEIVSFSLPTREGIPVEGYWWVSSVSNLEAVCYA
jgi:hypothetical protein